MIINKGKNVIVGTPDELRDKINGNPTVEITLESVTPEIIEATKRVNQVKQVNVDKSASIFTITLDDPQSGTPEIVKNIVGAGGLILGVNIVRPSLEEAYLKLIKEEKK
jgi:ABC-type multidrug transport system ATPase subunit